MGCTSDEGIEARIDDVRRRDRRYARHAYWFVLDALDHTMVVLGRDHRSGEERHIGGRELLDGIRDLASEQFGSCASLVFRQWGLRSTEDFGEIVFNLIDSGLLSRRAEDSRLDFAGGYDFDATFSRMFDERLSSLRARDLAS